MAARMAVLEGSAQIVYSVDAAWPLDFDPVGMPASEAFPDEWVALAAARRAYATGEQQRAGNVLALPLVWEADGSMWGVAISVA